MLGVCTRIDNPGNYKEKVTMVVSSWAKTVSGTCLTAFVIEWCWNFQRLENERDKFLLKIVTDLSRV